MREKNTDAYHLLKSYTNIQTQTAQGTNSMQTPLLESGHRHCWAYSLSHSIYELLRCFLSAAKVQVLYEKVFIAAKSPAATFRLPHASLPQAKPLPPLFCTRLMKMTKGQTNRKTDAIDKWLTNSAVDHVFKAVDTDAIGTWWVTNDGERLWLWLVQVFAFCLT